METQTETGMEETKGIHSVGLLLGLNEKSQVGACAVICLEIRCTRKDGSNVRRYEILTGTRAGTMFEAQEISVQECFDSIPAVCQGCRVAFWRGLVWPAPSRARGQAYKCHACRSAEIAKGGYYLGAKV